MYLDIVKPFKRPETVISESPCEQPWDWRRPKMGERRVVLEDDPAGCFMLNLHVRRTSAEGFNPALRRRI
jgi:hypothetical protein